MITPNQIREKRISTVSSDGYDRNEVNELLVEIIESYEAVCEENRELYRKMEILANRIEEYRADEDSIKTAIISAQKMADQVTANAKEKAEKALRTQSQLHLHSRQFRMLRRRQSRLSARQESTLLILQRRRLTLPKRLLLTHRKRLMLLFQVQRLLQTTLSQRQRISLLSLSKRQRQRLNSIEI